MTTFNDLNLDPKIVASIDKLGYTECTPVQSQTYDATFKGKDVLVQSQTGTGKTGAFLISILHQLSLNPNQKALILAPTRELALQITENANELNEGLGYHIVSIVGGTSYTTQLKELEKTPDILIGTPGRLIDLAQSKKVNFRHYNMLVIDEADRLLEMGFYQDLMKILRQTPKKEERQTMMFSATIHHKIKYLATREMTDPVEIHISPETLTVDAIEQSIYHVPKADKIKLLLGLLKKKNPEQVIIFSNMKQTSFDVSERLKANGYNSEHLIGDLSQSKRNRIIKEMQDGTLKILVATDIAARGLHIESLPLVVNYDLPNEPESYVHRIGRTGRAGQVGESISFGCEEGVYYLEDIEKLIEREIPVARYEESELVEDKAAGKRFRLEHKSDRRGSDRRGGSGSDRRGGSKSGPNRTQQKEGKPGEKRYEKPKHSNSSNSRYKDRKKDDSKSDSRESRSSNQNKRRYSDHKKDENRSKHKSGPNQNRSESKPKHTSKPKKTGLLGRLKKLFK